MSSERMATGDEAQIQGSSMRTPWQAFIKLAVVVLSFAWLVSRGYVDARALSEIGVGTAFSGVAILGAQNAGNALRLRWLLGWSGIRIATSRAFALTWIGFGFNQLLPGGAGGDVIRAYYTMQDHPDAKTTAIAIAIVDKAVGLAGLLLLAAVPGVLLVVSPQQFPAEVAAMVRLVSFSMSFGFVVVAAGAVAVSSAWLASVVARTSLDDWAERKSPGARALVGAVVSQLREHRGRILGLTIFSAALHFLSCIVLVFVARSLGDTQSFSLHVSIWSVVFLTTALPLSPGGLGVAETAAAQLWSLCGVTTGATTYLILRLLSLFHALLGIALYAGIRRRRNRAR